jgi:hypothetical protein
MSPLTEINSYPDALAASRTASEISMKKGLELVNIDSPIFPLAAGALLAALLVAASLSGLGVEALGVFEEVAVEEEGAGAGLHPAKAPRVTSK